MTRGNVQEAADCFGWSLLSVHASLPFCSSFRSCGCTESCISDLGSSDWFSQRYDPKQQPVLRDASDRFDSKALSWWLVRTMRNISTISNHVPIMGHIYYAFLKALYIMILYILVFVSLHTENDDRLHTGSDFSGLN